MSQENQSSYHHHHWPGQKGIAHRSSNDRQAWGVQQAGKDWTNHVGQTGYNGQTNFATGHCEYRSSYNNGQTFCSSYVGQTVNSSYSGQTFSGTNGDQRQSYNGQYWTSSGGYQQANGSQSYSANLMPPYSQPYHRQRKVG